MIFEILGKVGFDWQVALANLINFIVIYLILRKFAFGPVGKVISQRQKKIETGIKDAKEAKDALDSAQKDRVHIIDDAKKEAHHVATLATEQSKKIVDNAKDEAQLNADKIKEDAQIAITKSKQKMNELVAKETGNLVVKALEKTLKESMTEEADKEITSNMIKKLKKA